MLLPNGLQIALHIGVESGCEEIVFSQFAFRLDPKSPSDISITRQCY
jgi:hypothetical protein